ncbi:MAG: DUF4345 family protein [Pseudomonadales bacterium]|nr:DUF4345 family protein [Pseudomonadales bacterium]MCP5183025.1 DUF4345 family protein [Pseudomonadales bacterium]
MVSIRPRHVLRLLAPVFFIVGALHVLMGLSAEVLLGAQLPQQILGDPALDSQNRFYGAAFTVYGVLFLFGAADFQRYRPIVLAAVWTFFAAGLARTAAAVMTGIPPFPVLLLWAIELILPPVLAWWLRRQPDA